MQGHRTQSSAARDGAWATPRVRCNVCWCYPENRELNYCIY